MKSKFLYLSLLIMSIFTFSIFNVYAETTIDISKDSRFSKYVNLVKEAKYYNPIVVQSLEISNSYENCDYIIEKYPGQTVKNEENKSKVGFKINGEFYVNSLELNKSGTYKIKVYHYMYKNNIIKPMGTPVETFNIYLNLGYEPKISTTDFFVEHFINYDDFIAKIKNSFLDISATQITINNISKLKDTFLEVSKSKSDTSVVLKYNYRNITYEKEIIIRSVKNINSNKFITNSEEILKNVKNETYFFATENIKKLIGQTTSEFVDQYINIYNKLNYNSAQSLALSYSGGKETAIQPTLYKMTNVEFTLTDNLSGIENIPKINKTVFNLDCWSYPFQNNYLNNIGSYKPNIIFNENIVIPLNASNETIISILKENIKDKYVDVKIDDYSKGKDYTFSDYEISIIDANTNNLGSKSVTIKITVNTGIAKIILTNNQKIDVIITKEYEPKILTKYNKIVIKDNFDYSYQDEQIYVLDSDGSRITNLKYELQQKGINGYIIITAIDDNGFETSKKVPFVYEKEISKITNLLIKYGNFLRNLFNK